MDKHQDLILNVLTFEHPKEVVTMGFYKEKKPGMSALQEFEFPRELEAMKPNPAEGLDYLYTDFRDPGDANVQLEVRLSDSRNLARHYYNKLIYDAFGEVADIRKLNFVGSNELWFREPGKDAQGFSAYEKYLLRTSIGQYSPQPELTVMYDGTSFLCRESVMEYPGEVSDFNHVVMDGRFFRYEDDPEHMKIDPSRMHPVVNSTIRKRLNKFIPWKKKSNKVVRYYNHIEWFRKMLHDQGVLKDALSGLAGEWLRVKKDDHAKTLPGSDELTFGGNNTHKIPYDGLKRYKPYKAPAHKHLRILFILHQNDGKTIGNTLYKKMTGKAKGFIGLPGFINVPVNISPDHVFFSDSQNPLPEIAKELREREFDPKYRYLAIYLSPISKDDHDPAKHRVYYRIKEELLKRGITSQVIDRTKVSADNFKYSLPNIAVAILAKLGGIPWQLKEPVARELIVGIGACRNKNLTEPYLGSAFCFGNNGTFRGFQCFTKSDTTMLAGSIYDAVRDYVQKHNRVERLVIHFYKQLSYRDLRPIQRMLHNLGLDIPVIVVTINKTESKDIVLFDRKSEYKMPGSGTYSKAGYNTWLLSNNTLYPGTNGTLKDFPFPVKIKLASSHEDILEDEEQVNILIGQVYQFSRLYWKSVTQQSLPVTITYPEMVAEIFPHFESQVLPEYGRESLWFL